MGKKVLIVDNDQDFVDAMASLIEANGYVTVSANDGEAGFETAKTEKPDIVLLDVMMRHVSEGLDVAVKLRDEPATSGIPVVLLTGIRKPDFLASSYRPDEEWPNLKATLEKPVKPDELLRVIREHAG
jgi:CheY-like chemotaxis protein